MAMLRANNLSKIYRYEMAGLISSTVRKAVAAGLGMFTGREREPEANEFYALRDIDLTLDKGASLGIVGANGSGKSTLLKIIARITPPTTGEVLLYGRIGSLLEIGGGFNHELTGRENIFLLGSMLGMPLAEIRNKFDDIVAFAGVDVFLHTQLKRYSPGMQVRLAFSVVVHYKPEIVLFDEILAVVDTEFQARCLDKIGELKSEGVTVIFVSHDLEKMRTVCDRTIWLSKGKVQMDADTPSVHAAYLNSIAIGSSHPL